MSLSIKVEDSDVFEKKITNGLKRSFHQTRKNKETKVNEQVFSSIEFKEELRLLAITPKELYETILTTTNLKPDCF